MFVTKDKSVEKCRVMVYYACYISILYVSVMFFSVNTYSSYEVEKRKEDENDKTKKTLDYYDWNVNSDPIIDIEVRTYKE
jgi:translation elongation factor P/translation initiation factor 5A